MSSSDRPVFRAFGDDDDHLRLSVLVARAFESVDPDARAVCERPNAPWRARAEALEALLLGSKSRAAPAVLVDPDALAPRGDDDPWEDPGFRHERRALFETLLRAARRGGWELVRTWPRADLAEAFEGLRVANDEAAPDEPLFGALVPAARPLARWLRSRGALGERRLAKLVEEEGDLSRIVLDEACAALPAATLRVADVVALLRPPQSVNGHLGPFALGDSAAQGVLASAEVDCLRAGGFLQPDLAQRVSMPAAVRQALRERGRTLRTETEVESDHAWLSRRLATDAADAEGAIEAHHHAVEAGDLDRARTTARFYGADLRTLAFRLGRAAAATGDRAGFLRAAEAYRVVLDDFDATDAYSWEYYAFNLAQGRGPNLPECDAEEIERAYVRAHELAPHNPLFHGRLTGFRAQRGAYDRAAVDRTIARYRGTEGPRGSAFFGQPVIHALRRIGRHSEADDLARRWNIRPLQHGVRPASERGPRRFGSAAGTIRLANDFDAPLEDFAPYE